MSTVKIKTEPTTTAAAVDVQVKLEPSLSTADIKLEQHTSDVDTKVESDSDTGSEEDDIKSENDDGIDDGEEDTNQSQRQFICEYSGCSHSYSQSGNLVMHQHEHRLQAELNIHGKTYTLTRQSLDGRWPCPFPDCTSTLKTIDGIRGHIRRCHGNTVRHQQPSTVKTRINLYFLEVDSFYVKDARCGYHTTIGLFICHKCRLVPECLLTHLQQKHGYSEKSIHNSTLPDSAVNAGADPNINQHISNPHLKSAISCPHWQQHPDIVHGWLCVTSDCGYCGYVTHNKTDHRTLFHQGEQLITVPALVLRLTSMRKHTSYFLITRIDQASGAVTTSQNRANWYKLNYNHNGLDSQDEIEDDVSQNENLKESDQKRQWKCEYPDCGSFFNSSDKLCKHRREHKLKTVLNILGTTFVPSRKSSDDRWPCPIPDCQSTYQKVDAISKHIQTAHRMSMKQKYADSEDDNNEQHQIVKKKRCTFQYLQVDDFYVRGIKCGYHRMTGVFICHECRLVPECLLTHMQQKHGYDEKSIDNSALPESAVNASAGPNINQHTSNSLLAAAIRNPHWQQHQDIVEGWLCTTADCGYCGYTADIKASHKKKMHRGERLATVPALVLRLVYGKTHTLSFLITRIDQANSTVIASSNGVKRHSLDYSHDRLNTQDENGDDVDQNESTDTSIRNQQWKCEYTYCGSFFNSSDKLCKHRCEHKLEVMIIVHGSTFTLSRQSLDHRWPCPVPDCEAICKTVDAVRHHIQNAHGMSMKQKRASIEDYNNQQQHPAIKKKQRIIQYLNVNGLYVNEILCGYHNTTGLFICYECRLVPECLLTHLQQKHEFNEKSIDNQFMPESARVSGNNPNGNQHLNNLLLATTIRQPYQRQHPDIVQGWLCTAPDCGYSCITKIYKRIHQYKRHKGEQQLTAPALVLRLFYAKTQASCLLITRLDTIINNVKPSELIGQQNSECDDGDELVLSDMGDDSDIH